jgi:hypothetical protein
MLGGERRHRRERLGAFLAQVNLTRHRARADLAHQHFPSLAVDILVTF